MYNSFQGLKALGVMSLRVKAFPSILEEVLSKSKKQNDYKS